MTDVGRMQAAPSAPAVTRSQIQVVPLRGLPIVAAVVVFVIEPANIAVLFEMRKARPDGTIIAKLMRRFVYTAGITGLMQVATLIIMTRVATQ